MKLTVPYSLYAEPNTTKLATVEGEQIGAFMIHETLVVDGARAANVEDWTVTHVGTGHRIGGALDRAHAKVAADSLNAMPVNWKFTDPAATASFTTHHVRRVQDILKRAVGFRGSAG